MMQILLLLRQKQGKYASKFVKKRRYNVVEEIVGKY
jgi:hypothetical protein